MSSRFEAYEMQPSASPSSSRSDQDQRPQCWRDVEAETGFSSYLSFLETSPDTGPQLERLRKILHRSREGFWGRGNEFGEVFVLDILKDRSLSMKINFHSEENSATGPTQLLQCLRSPPENLPARVVLWSIPWGCHPAADMIDALGLGLKIDPPFFQTLISTIFSSNSISWIPVGSRQIIIGNSVATVARNYRLEGSVPPVLLVVEVRRREPDIKPHSKGQYAAYTLIEMFFKEGIGRSISLHHSPVDKATPNSSASMSSNQYLSLLSNHLQKSPNVDVEEDVLLLILLVPLFHLEVLLLRAACRIVQYALLDVQYQVEDPGGFNDGSRKKLYDKLNTERFWLRRRLDGFEESRKHFARLVSSKDAAKRLQSNTYLKEEEEDFKEAVVDARAIDAEVRDYMQLQIGNLSILESRKSIQLSNQQINEAKRVKIFTVLAFAYIPINLATSVFGMNLQQLNHSGQSLWSFFVTAIVALFVTGLIWFCLELYNSVVESKKRREERWGIQREKTRSIAIRVAMSLGFIEKWET